MTAPHNKAIKIIDSGRVETLPYIYSCSYRRLRQAEGVLPYVYEISFIVGEGLCTLPDVDILAILGRAWKPSPTFILALPGGRASLLYTYSTLLLPVFQQKEKADEYSSAIVSDI